MEIFNFVLEEYDLTGDISKTNFYQIFHIALGQYNLTADRLKIIFNNFSSF